jgi:hypothetical protein
MNGEPSTTPRVGRLSSADDRGVITFEIATLGPTGHSPEPIEGCPLNHPPWLALTVGAVGAALTVGAVGASVPARIGMTSACSGHGPCQTRTIFGVPAYPAAAIRATSALRTP